MDPFSENIDFIGLSTLSSRTVEGAPFNGVRFSSYFTRVNYEFDDKYLFSVVLRRDGSSRFGEESRFGTFPAFSGAWRISAGVMFSAAMRSGSSGKRRDRWLCRPCHSTGSVQRR